jgi:Chromate transporter
MGTEPQLTMTRRTASGMDVPRGRTRVSFEAVAHLAELADFNVAFALRAVCQLRVAGDHSQPRSPPPSSVVSRPVREVDALFVKLGGIGFGGPTAHIALMRDEVVGRRRWMDDREFLDWVGATT